LLHLDVRTTVATLRRIFPAAEAADETEVYAERDTYCARDLGLMPPSTRRSRSARAELTSDARAQCADRAARRRVWLKVAHVLQLFGRIAESRGRSISNPSTEAEDDRDEDITPGHGRGRVHAAAVACSPDSKSPGRRLGDEQSRQAHRPAQAAARRRVTELAVDDAPAPGARKIPPRSFNRERNRAGDVRRGRHGQERLIDKRGKLDPGLNFASADTTERVAEPAKSS